MESVILVFPQFPDLRTMTNGSAFECPQFSRIPPFLEVSSHFGSQGYLPATYDNVAKLLANTPHNATLKQFYRSYTARVFKNAAKMAENLFAV